MNARSHSVATPKLLYAALAGFFLGAIGTVALAFADLAADFIVAEMVWFTASFLLLVVGIIQRGDMPHPKDARPGSPLWYPAGIPPEYDPEKHPEPPKTFHVMGGVPWGGTVSTEDADKAYTVIRKLFRPKRDRE